MEQIERVLSVASGDELAKAHAVDWTSGRTAAMAGVLHKLLHTYTETAISVTSGLITSITRFAVQVIDLPSRPVLPARAALCVRSALPSDIWKVVQSESLSCHTNRQRSISTTTSGFPPVCHSSATRMPLWTVTRMLPLPQAGVSMVLSFMIVWDLPTIRGGVASLRTSRLAPVYEEIAPSFAVFGTLFGKALQAQVSLVRRPAVTSSAHCWARRCIRRSSAVTQAARVAPSTRESGWQGLSGILLSSLINAGCAGCTRVHNL